MYFSILPCILYIALIVSGETAGQNMKVWERRWLWNVSHFMKSVNRYLQVMKNSVMSGIVFPQIFKFNF